MYETFKRLIFLFMIFSYLFMVKISNHILIFHILNIQQIISMFIPIDIFAIYCLYNIPISYKILKILYLKKRFLKKN